MGEWFKPKVKNLYQNWLLWESEARTLSYFFLLLDHKNLGRSSNRFARPSIGTGCPNKFGVGLQNIRFILFQTYWDTLYQVVRGNRRENVKCLKTDLLAWHTNSLIQFDIRTRNGSNLRKPPKREDQGMNENEYSLLWGLREYRKLY